MPAIYPKSCQLGGLPHFRHDLCASRHDPALPGADRCGLMVFAGRRSVRIEPEDER